MRNYLASILFILLIQKSFQVKCEVNGLNHKDSFFYYCQVLTFKLPVDAADEDENIDYRSHDNKLKLDLESIGSSLKVQ